MYFFMCFDSSLFKASKIEEAASLLLTFHPSYCGTRHLDSILSTAVSHNL